MRSREIAPQNRAGVTAVTPISVLPPTRVHMGSDMEMPVTAVTAPIDGPEQESARASWGAS